MSKSLTAEIQQAPAPPTLTELQKLTLRDKFRDADEAARLASADVLAKEIAAFMVARTSQAQDKNAAAMSYYNGLPKVEGYVITREGEYVKPPK